jgi:hypothetical protein
VTTYVIAENPGVLHAYNERTRPAGHPPSREVQVVVSDRRTWHRLRGRQWRDGDHLDLVGHPLLHPAWPELFPHVQVAGLPLGGTS